MKKRFRVIAMLLVVSMLVAVCPMTVTKAAAATKYMVLTTSRDNVCVRKEPQNKGAVLERVPYGTTLYAEEIVKNSKGNKWYVLRFESQKAYIFEGNVIDTKKTVTKLPGDEHVCETFVSVEMGNVYSSVDQNTHYKTINTKQICAVCSAEQKRDYTVVQEPHDFQSGKCICGIQKPVGQTVMEIAKTTSYVLFPMNAVNDWIASTIAAEVKQPGFGEKFTKQLVEGNSTDPENVTFTETFVELGVSASGLDLPLDIKSLVMDVKNVGTLVEQNGGWGTAGILFLDAVAFLPLIGSVKHADDVVDGIKAAEKVAKLADASNIKIIKQGTKQAVNAADSAATVIKQSDNISTVVKQAEKSSEIVNSVTDTVTDIVTDVGKKSDTGKRVIPGVDGVVTGGDSTKLGKNMMEEMGLPRSTKWTGYQAQHLIPVELASHPVIKKIGMDMDDASNGIFLRAAANGDISVGSRHTGYHSVYNKFVESQLDAMDIGQSSLELQKQLAELQGKLRKLQTNGVTLYNSAKKENTTLEMLQRLYDKLD